MCEFISWVEKEDKVYFLTSKQTMSPRGKELKLRFKGEGELLGHASIRAYFDIVGGNDKECSDFSTPDNFPQKIVTAVKQGKFSTFPFHKGLLLKPLDEKYETDRKSLGEKYWGLFTMSENRNPRWR